MRPATPADNHGVVRASALAFCLAWLLAPPAVAAPPWIAQIGAGVTSSYAYQQHSTFSPTWNTFAAVTRSIGQHFTLESKLGLTRFQQGIGLGVADETIFAEADVLAQYLSLGVSLRYYPDGHDARAATPYLVAGPTLSHARWRERYEYVMVAPYPSGREVYSSSTLIPGFEAGLGFLGPFIARTRLDVGGRFRYTADIDARDLRFTWQPRGLRQFDLIASVNFPL